MPTPFMHLQVAEGIRSALAAQPNAHQSLRVLLSEEWPAFYLGSVAPDYQTICDVPRETTHFYRLPPAPNNKAYDRMLGTYPRLMDAAHLPGAQTAFVAAYAAHLMLDLIWFREILVPHIVMAPDLGDRAQRFLVHNILLTYLDKLALESLPPGADEDLARAEPNGWLPFATDTQLIAWRDMLVDQLRPGAMTQTIQIYAERMAMTPEEFAARIDDPEWMEQRVFSRLPVADVQKRLREAVPASIALSDDYLHGRLVPAAPPKEETL